jgi:hypothetical protein
MSLRDRRHVDLQDASRDSDVFAEPRRNSDKGKGKRPLVDFSTSEASSSRIPLTVGRRSLPHGLGHLDLEELNSSPLPRKRRRQTFGGLVATPSSPIRVSTFTAPIISPAMNLYFDFGALSKRTIQSMVEITVKGLAEEFGVTIEQALEVLEGTNDLEDARRVLGLIAKQRESLMDQILGSSSRASSVANRSVQRSAVASVPRRSLPAASSSVRSIHASRIPSSLSSRIIPQEELEPEQIPHNDGSPYLRKQRAKLAQAIADDLDDQADESSELGAYEDDEQSPLVKQQAKKQLFGVYPHPAFISPPKGGRWKEGQMERLREMEFSPGGVDRLVEEHGEDVMAKFLGL